METVCKSMVKREESMKTDLRAVEYESILQCCCVLIRIHCGLLNMIFSVAYVLKARKFGMISVHFHVKHVLAM